MGFFGDPGDPSDPRLVGVPCCDLEGIEKRPEGEKLATGWANIWHFLNFVFFFFCMFS